MNNAQKYLQEQLANPEFNHSFLDEKAQLDIEYQQEELKREVD